MKRKDFIYYTGMGLGSLMIPKTSLFGRSIDPAEALQGVDAMLKKELADVALNAAKAKGAGREVPLDWFTQDVHP